MADSSPDIIPQPHSGVDIKSLPIGPEEAFVLSRVDGFCSIVEIALATGLDAARVGEAVAKLAELGAVSVGSDNPNTTRPPQPSRSPKPEPDPAKRTASVSRLARPVLESTSPVMSSHPGAASYDTALLDEPDVDLSRDIRRQVLEKFDILDTADHYELLGVSRDAEKKFIKRAYYDLVIIYHPDKYFGKRLGSFAPKIGKVFERMTKAYETLTRKRTRAEYDAYLGGRERTAQLDSSRTNLQRQRDELERVQRELEREARAQASSRPSMSSVQVRRPPDPAARRAALRRRLGGRGSEPTPTTTDPAPPPPSPEQVLDAASDDLKRRYEQRLSKMRQDRVGRYQRVAQEALESDDPVSAANALRIAASLAPNNTEIAATLEATSKRADKVVAESYSEQARYEERNGNLLEAANSYGRAARAAHDNPRLFYKAASLLVRSEGDSKTAVEMAKSAVSLAPDRVEHRLVLARAFAMAGMMKSALAEVDRVLESHKGNDEAKQLLRELRRS